MFNSKKIRLAEDKIRRLEQRFKQMDCNHEKLVTYCQTTWTSGFGCQKSGHIVECVSCRYKIAECDTLEEVASIIRTHRMNQIELEIDKLSKEFDVLINEEG